jgi:hypothetical protein
MKQPVLSPLTLILSTIKEQYQFLEEKIQTANNYMKKSSIFLAIKEMQNQNITYRTKLSTKQ